MTKIQSLVSTECWRFVPSETNPVDLATRHNFVNDVIIKRWKNGPEFLLQPERNWPVQKECHGLQELNSRRRRNHR